MRSTRRSGFTLIELLVAIAIIAVLLALLVASAQKARTAAEKVYCANNLKEIGIALHSYHSIKGSFPPGSNGQRSPSGGQANPFHLAWMAYILPYIEQDNVWQKSRDAYKVQSWPWTDPHPRDLVMKIYCCPQDKRVLQAHFTSQNVTVALTSYLGVNGTNLRAHDGVLYCYSKVRLMDITDGASNTLMVGERPPSEDLIFGWWYAGAGQFEEPSWGSTDVHLGVSELNIGCFGYPCPAGPYTTKPGDIKNICDMYHFWSMHPGGSLWLFADGHVSFVPYTGVSVLPAMATRNLND